MGRMGQEVRSNLGNRRQPPVRKGPHRVQVPAALTCVPSLIQRKCRTNPAGLFQEHRRPGEDLRADQQRTEGPEARSAVQLGHTRREALPQERPPCRLDAPRDRKGGRVEAPERQLGRGGRHGGHVPGRGERHLHRLLDLEERQEDATPQGGRLQEVPTEGRSSCRSGTRTRAQD